MNSSEQHIETIQSVENLVTALSEEERTEFGSILRSLDIPFKSFNQVSSWCDDSYTRNCIAENEKFELILLCWEAGQTTPIHDHGGEECWVKVLSGEFEETIYELDDEENLIESQTSISKAGDLTYMIDFMGYHSLENVSRSRSLTLHLYAKPIRNCNAFDQNLGKFVNKDLTYDTVA